MPLVAGFATVPDVGTAGDAGAMIGRNSRRDAREAEGAPLLREYRVKSLIEGSNPSLSATHETASARRLFHVWRRERFVVKTRGSTKTAGLPFCTAQPPRRGEGHGWPE
jgi:hypothetical protein